MSRIKHEEIVPISDMVLASFTRDQVTIEAENTTYTPQYLADFVVMANEVRELQQSEDQMTTQKGITKQLYIAANDLNKDIKLFQIVIEKSGLDTKITSDLLKNIRTRNIEGALINLKSIGQLIGTNSALLTSKGMKPTLSNIFNTAFTTLTNLSNQQTQIMKDRKLLTNDNHGSYKALEDYITDICQIGKTIFNGEAKADEYNVTKLLTKLHVVHPKK